MSLAKEVYKEACEFLEAAAKKDRSKMQPKERELHDEYVAYYKNIKEEIVNSSTSSSTEDPRQASIRLIKLGMSTPLISKTTGLSFSEIELLRPKKKKGKR